MDNHQLKQRRRNEIKQILSEISLKERRYQEQQVVEHLFQMTQWKKAQTIALTKSMPIEFSVDLIVQQARLENKQLFVPIVCSERKMKFVLWEETTLFQLTKFGIEEPINATFSKKITEIDLVIVPGLLYTKEGYRLGFGGGYYDHALQNTSLQTVSLLYKQQLVNTATWPIEEWDYPVDILITAEGVWKNESVES